MAAALCLASVLGSSQVYAGGGTQKVVKHGDDVIVSFRYRDGMDMHLEIGRCGVNKLMNVKAIYIESDSSGDASPRISPRSRLLVKSGTDWIGPYTVRSNQAGDTSRPSFTGGWHGGNGDGTGNPTAWMESLSVTIDGQSMMDDSVYTGDVRIHAVNYITAYNTISTGKPVLREEVTYFITHGVVNVQVASSALSSITILKYYGLQTQDFSNVGMVRYGNGKEYELGRYSDCGSKGDGNIVNEFSVTDAKDDCMIVAGIDTSEGLGHFDGISDDRPTVFTPSYGKTYFDLIFGKSKVMREGDEIRWKGWYKFE